MKVSKAATALFFVLAALPALVRADNFGPHRDLGQVQSDVRRLLAQRVRATGVDPKAIALSDVVVVKDQALLSWDSGKQHGVMGLVRYLDRWWDALDDVTRTSSGYCWRGVAAFPLTATDIAQPPSPQSLARAGLSADLVKVAASHNADVRDWPAACRSDATTSDVRPSIISAAGAAAGLPRSVTAGYILLVSYSANDASTGTRFARIYGRAPTAGEILSNPAPPRGLGGASDVFYFDLEVSGTRPVTFTPGTKLDIWVPFVLDDTLSYRVSFVMDGQFSKSIHGTVFDNALHFELPQFGIAPPNTLQAEVEGF